MNKKLIFLSLIILLFNNCSLAMEELTTWVTQNSVYIAMAQCAVITGLVSVCAWNWYSHQRQINQIKSLLGDVESNCIEIIHRATDKTIKDTVESLLVELTGERIDKQLEDKIGIVLRKKEIDDSNIINLRGDILKITFNLFRLAKFIFSPFAEDKMSEQDEKNFMPYYLSEWEDKENILTLLQKMQVKVIKKSESRESVDIKKKLVDSDTEIFEEVFSDYVELQISPRTPSSRSSSPDKLNRSPLTMITPMLKSPRKDKGKSVEPTFRRSFSYSAIDVPTKKSKTSTTKKDNPLTIPKLNLRQPIPSSSSTTHPSPASSASSSGSSPSSSPEG